MANNSSATIGGQTGWSAAVALRNGPLSLNSSLPTRLASKDQMISSLNASDPVTYTMPRLLNMTHNDMVFALRNIFEPGNI